MELLHQIQLLTNLIQDNLKHKIQITIKLLASPLGKISSIDIARTRGSKTNASVVVHIREFAIQIKLF